MCTIIRLALLFLLLPIASLQAQTALCRAAIAAAEAAQGIPDRLLLGIGRVESGRRDPETGGFDPWPWTINAEGRGSYYPSREAAIAAVQALRDAGVQSMDVGCMQVNLRHHPDAFANLEEAFDPMANARYAARFLRALQARAGDWMTAAGHYHSQTPARAEAYRARLAQVLERERRAPTAAPPLSSPQAAALLFAAPATAGALAAYRQAPIPLVGRTTRPATRAELAQAARGLAMPAARAGAPTAARLVTARAPHVPDSVGPAGIGNRRLF